MLVIVFSTDILMVRRTCLIDLVKKQRLLVESVFEDGLHAFVRVPLDMECPDAGVFQPLRVIVFSQSYDAQRRSEALFRMGPVFHDSGDKLFGVGAVVSRPPDDPGRSPLEVALMGFGHVLREGGKKTLLVVPFMTGNPSIFKKDLYGVACDAHIDLFFDQLVGDTIVVVFNLDMVVDIDHELFPFGVLKPVNR